MNEAEHTPPSVWPAFVAYGAAMLALMVGGAAVLTAFLLLEGGGTAGTVVEKVVRSPSFLLWSTLLSDTVFAGTALLATRLEGEAPARRLRWTGTGRLALPGVLLVLGLSEASDRVIVLSRAELGTTMQHLATAVRDAPALPFAALTLLVVLAGLAEELFFRGYMQTRLGWRWTPGVAIIVSAGLFGLAHFDPVHSTATLVLGIALGALVEAGDSLRPAVVAHCANNLFAAVNTRYLSATWYARAHLPVLGAGLTVAAAGALWLWRTARRAGPE